MGKTNHLAVEWPPQRKSASRSFRYRVAAAACKRHAATKHTREIRKASTETDDGVNQARALSGVVERPDNTERRRSHQGKRAHSPGSGAENRMLRNYLALL